MWLSAGSGSTGSMLIAASAAAGIVAKVSTAAGPSAARAWSISAAPSAGSPQQQPRSATRLRRAAVPGRSAAVGRCGT